jgi:hypothetical protein
VLASLIYVLLLEIILQLNYSSMPILRFGIIALKPHVLSYLSLFRASNEIVLFCKSRHNDRALSYTYSRELIVKQIVILICCTMILLVSHYFFKIL